MRCGSLFSGIGGFDLGFERAGFEISWQVEIEKFPREVLRARFPKAKRYSDVCKVGARNLRPVDVICAGVPCQDVSVAGKRSGLKGERTGLFFEFARVLRELRPAWFVFENVPGFFSSNQGRDFAEVQRVLMVECGYGISWRVLNSQFFGVAQRRRRLFVVGSLGKPCPAEILFEPEGGGGDSEAGRKARQEIAGPLGGGAYGTGRRDEDDPNLAVTLSAANHDKSHAAGRRREDDFNIVTARTLTGSCWKRHDEDTDTLVAATLRESDGHHGRSSPRGDGCDNLITEPGEHLVAAPIIAGYGKQLDSSDTGGGPPNAIISSPLDPDGVRDFAGLPKGLDSARYRALGNAVTVQVAEFIARRILRFAKGES